MRILVKEMVKMDVCAGAIAGRELLSKLLTLTAREPDQPERVLIDFQGIEVATASFLRESVIAFRNIVRGRRSNFYPVVANAQDVVAEELTDILQSRSDALILCDVGAEGDARSPRMVGRLEPKQKRIFDLILERRELDASQLQKEFGDAQGVKQTAWNNRLSALSQAGLVMEFSEGRNKRYRPLFEGV
jgi:hypothetical protein